MVPPDAIVQDDIGWPANEAEWRAVQRPLLMKRLSGIYGRTPDVPISLSTARVADDQWESGGARLLQTAVTLTGPHGEWRYTVAAVVPQVRPLAGTLLGLNFRGNHAMASDERIRLCDGADPRLGRLYYENAEFLPPAARGSVSQRWPLDLIAASGFAVVTYSYLQCGPDSRGVFETGPHLAVTGTPARQRDDWGAIGIWAWTLSRTLDLVLEGHLTDCDPGPVVAFGHSRLGKTALWAAAQDERFAGAISNESGAMGAALSRAVGETPAILAHVRPYWFAPAFSADVLSGLPLHVDQDHLLAAIAPRPLMVGSAEDDVWADPEGERLSTERATRVWELYGAADRVHHHQRPGGHDFLRRDWEQYLAHLTASLGSDGPRGRTHV